MNTPDPTGSGLPRWVLPAILLTTVAAYLNSFPNPFVWDDRSLILGNERIRAWRNLGAIFSHTIPLGPLFGGTPSQAYRPLYELALAVDYALWGTTPLGFHLTNVLLHLANVVLLLRLLCGFVPPWPAACTVGLWAVHPILTEAITLVSARNHLLFALFVLAGLLLWRRGCATDTRHSWRWLIAGGACMTAGLLSHELAISFPLLALLVHAAGGPERPLGVRGALAARAPAYAGLLLVAGAYLGLRLTVLPLGGPLRPGALLENLGPRLLFLPQLFTTYLGFILVPLHLSLDHGSAVRFPTSVLEPGVLGTGLFLVVLGTAAWRVRHRTWLPLLGLLWFAIALLPVSNLLPFYAVIGERYLYLPAAGLLLALVGTGAWLLPTPPARLAVARALLPLLLVGLLGTRTMLRNLDYRDDLRLYAASLAATPDSPLLHNNLGYELLERRDHAGAARHLRRAIELRPTYAKAWLNLGLTYASQHRLEPAIDAYREALRLRPDLAVAHHHLAQAYRHLGRLDAAARSVAEAIRLQPDYPPAHLNLAQIYQRQGREQEALAAYERFLRLAHPEDPRRPAVQERVREIRATLLEPGSRTP